MSGAAVLTERTPAGGPAERAVDAVPEKRGPSGAA